MTLERKVVFVGGPIQYTMEASGKFDPFLGKLLVKAMDDLERGGFRTFSAHRYERFGEMDVTGQENDVCARDFNWMRACDCFIAVLPGTPDGVPFRSDGTAVELGWASGMGKKIVIIRSQDVTYSHLVAGLRAVADVTYVSVDEFLSPGFEIASLVGRLLEAAGGDGVQAGGA